MEFKELFALKPAEPIISLGLDVVYQELVLPEDPPVNELQRVYTLKQPEKKENAEEPKRELTKAEKARERKAQRVREREERRERWRREGEERRREEEERRREEDARNMAQRAQAAPQRVQAVPVAAPQRVAAPAAPVRHNLDDPAIKAQVDALDPGTRRLKFWEIITRLGWHNASDGAMPAGPINALFNGLTAADALTFKLEYENMFNGAVEFLRADGMFDRNGANDHQAQARIVSHIIALGEDQYVTLIGDPAILQFLVESGECQSLNNLLPENIKI